MSDAHVVVVEVGGAPAPAALVGYDTRSLPVDDPALPGAVAEADGLVVWDGATPAFHAAFEEAAAATGLPRLRWVHTSSAGPDRLLFPALREHPSTLTCSRGILDRDIAEYVLAGVLALLKDLPTTVRLQTTRTWRHRTTRGLRGRRALVVGAGSIGTSTAGLFAALGVPVDGVVRSTRPSAPPFGRFLGPDELVGAVGGYDLVLVTAPLTADTRGLVGPDVVAAMAPGTIVVNVGRGPVVDEDALLAALRAGHLGGVVLDVFATEPLPADSGWWDAPGAIVSPHLAGDADGFDGRLAERLTEQLERFSTGADLLDVVDKGVGY